jgi:probable rRNA maturation factor
MSDSEISLVYRGAPRGLRRRELRRFAESLSAAIAGGRGFTCLIARDDELRRLNRDFRGKDSATDVLSFPSSSRETLGDIAISADRAAEQAQSLGHAVDQEIRILMLHGVLHLLGLDHETDKGRMARMERRYRIELGLPAGLIERVAR